MSTYFLSRGGLLFVAKSDIRIATGLVKGKMCLTEFYRTAIVCKPISYQSYCQLFSVHHTLGRYGEHYRSECEPLLLHGLTTIGRCADHYWSARGAIVLCGMKFYSSYTGR